jgi:SAM-dependent methyltransferase
VTVECGRWIMRGNGKRKTRLHSLRGDLLPPPSWIDVVRALRGRGDHTPRPWLSLAAMRYMDRLVDRRLQVLECGAGTSSAWYAGRVGRLWSLESNERWFEYVHELLDHQGTANYELIFAPLETWPARIAQFPDRSLDLVIVDHDEVASFTRLAAIGSVKSKVRPGGVLMLDDSDRPELVDAKDTLPGWDVHRVIGVKSSPLEVVETSFFQRPHDA